MIRLDRFAGRRVDIAAAASVGAAAALLHLPRALTNPFWQDEVASARILREPTLGRVLGHVTRTESTPPLWYVIGWAVHRASVPLVDVRVVSVVCGGAFAALVVLFARKLLPSASAVLAGVLVSVGGQFAFADRELRAYALLALLAAVFALTLAHQLRRPRVAAVAAVTAAGMLTHYFFVFTVAGGLVWLWLEPEARAVRVRTTTAIAAGVALTSPWFPYALRQYRQDRYAWIGPFDAREVVNTPFRLFTPLVHTEWMPLAFLILVVAGAVRLARRSAYGRLCAALALAPVIGASTLWLAGARVYADRNLIGCGGFIAICAIGALPIGLARIRVAAVVAAGATAIASFVLVQTPPTPFAQIARTLISEGWHSGDPVAVFGSPYSFRSPLEWYLPRAPQLAIFPSPRCLDEFVVGGRRTVRNLADDISGSRDVGSFVVARARLDEHLRGESWLDAPRPTCARRESG
ncbi:MAG TPA: glycosyltransferase family 39 protein [Gaiellaceae bacterium]